MKALMSQLSKVASIISQSSSLFMLKMKRADPNMKMNTKRMKKKGSTSRRVSKISLMKNEVESNKRSQSSILSHMTNASNAQEIQRKLMLGASIRINVRTIRAVLNMYCKRSSQFYIDLKQSLNCFYRAYFHSMQSWQIILRRATIPQIKS